MFPGNFEAITKAAFIRDNAVKYVKLPAFYGQCFCKVMITDSRFANEEVFVASGSLI